MEDRKVYCISYDLCTPNRNYNDLYDAIKSFGSWWHQTESVWFIISSKSAVEIRDYLLCTIDNNDKLFVIEVCKHWAGKGFLQEEYDWLNDN